MEGREGREGREEAVEDRVEELCRVVFDGGLKVHRTLGPGLLESAYEHFLWRELTLRGLKAERQVALAIEYEGVREENAYRIDLLVEDQIIVELKTTPTLMPSHRAQLQTYLKLSGHPTGFLMNFNVVLFKDGVRRLKR